MISGSAREVSARITGCSAQGGNASACALQATPDAPLAVNTVFSVGIGGGGFANPSAGDRPQVTAIHNCPVPPLPSPYLALGTAPTRATTSTSAPAGARPGVVTFGEAVTGAAGADITQPVPGLGASTATFVLP